MDGAANTALETLLARSLGVALSRVRVARGGQSRLKAVEIDGIEAESCAAALGAHLGS